MLTLMNSLRSGIGMGQSYCHLVQVDERYYSSQLCRYSVDRGVCFLIDELQAGSAKLEAPRCALRINHAFINLCLSQIIAVANMNVGGDLKEIQAVA